MKTHWTKIVLVDKNCECLSTWDPEFERPLDCGFSGVTYYDPEFAYAVDFWANEGFLKSRFEVYSQPPGEFFSDDNLEDLVKTVERLKRSGR